MSLFFQAPPRRQLERGKTYRRAHQLKQRIRQICKEDTSNEYIWPTTPLREVVEQLGSKARQKSTNVLKESYRIPANADHAEVLVRSLLTKLCVDSKSTGSPYNELTPEGHISLKNASPYYQHQLPGLEYLHLRAQEERQHKPSQNYELELSTDIPGVSVGFAGPGLRGYSGIFSMPLEVTFYLDPTK